MVTVRKRVLLQYFSPFSVTMSCRQRDGLDRFTRAGDLSQTLICCSTWNSRPCKSPGHLGSTVELTRWQGWVSLEDNPASYMLGSRAEDGKMPSYTSARQQGRAGPDLMGLLMCKQEGQWTDQLRSKALNWST